jgi:hypothetical protein
LVAFAVMAIGSVVSAAVLHRVVDDQERRLLEDRNGVGSGKVE